MLPLVNRMTRAMSGWLAPAYGGALELRADLDQVEALNPEREALWARLNAATFLTDDEKRAAAGYALLPPSANPSHKYSPDQPRVPAGNPDGGQWTGGGGGSGGDVVVGDSGDDGLSDRAKKYSVNLVEEDARGGHAFRDHVGKSDAELIGVVQNSVIRGTFVSLYKDAQGSFLSSEAANDFTNRVLRMNTLRVDAVASGAIAEDWLAEKFGYPTGKEAFRAGPKEPVYIRPTYAVGVLIRHDPRSPRGYRVHTSYPVNERAK